LHSSGKGGFVLDVQLPPGHYEYKYLVDDEWIHDPEVKCAANTFGSMNNLLDILPPSSSPQRTSVSASTPSTPSAKSQPIKSRQATLDDPHSVDIDGIDFANMRMCCLPRHLYLLMF
jgi:hypothetical protein